MTKSMVLDIISRCACDELKEELGPELLNMHEKLLKLEANRFEKADYCFIEGFKLGLRVGIEGAES